MIELRPYQKAASDAAVTFLKSTMKGNGLIVMPTGSGKSVMIADIAHRLEAPILIFCPSREILLQNHEKMEKVEKGLSTMYSASVGMKKISTITFATIGSVMNHIVDFDVFKYIIVDEAHLVNAKDGMYKRFIQRRADRRVIGTSATPYRLTQASDGASVLEFLTRTQPRIFDKLLYYCQITELLSKGYLAELKYHDHTKINLRNVSSNATGSDFDESSLMAEYKRSGFEKQLLDITLRVLHPKSGKKRNGILVFTRFIREAENLVAQLARERVKAVIVTGETPKKEREKLLNDFKTGKVQVVVNSMVLTTGFDYPELDTVILARPTKSLALYYQMTGRAIRPCKGKNAWIVDISGSYQRFGAVSDLKIGLEREGTERWAVFSKGRQLTNVKII